MVFGDGQVGVVGRDRLPLLGHLETAVDRARSLGHDGPVGGAAATADGTAAAVEERQLDAVAPSHLRQAGLGSIEHPHRGQEARLLVRIGVAEHHFLAIAARRQVAPIAWIGQQSLKQLAAAGEGVARLEQRHHVELGRSRRDSARGTSRDGRVGGDLRQLQDPQHVVGRAGEADDVAMAGILTEAALDRRGRAEGGHDLGGRDSGDDLGCQARAGRFPRCGVANRLQRRAVDVRVLA